MTPQTILSSLIVRKGLLVIGFLYSLISVAGCAGKEKGNPASCEPSEEKGVVETIKETIKTVGNFPADVKTGCERTYDDLVTAIAKHQALNRAQTDIDTSCGGDRQDSEQCARAKENFRAINASRRTNSDVREDIKNEREMEKAEQVIITGVMHHKTDAGVQKVEAIGQTAVGVAGGSSSRENKHPFNHTKVQTGKSTSQSSKSNQEKTDQSEEPDLG